MKTYTGRRNLFGSLCNNSNATTLGIADTLINMAERRILSSRDWPFLWKQYTRLTVANQQAYKLPAYTEKPQGIYVTVSGQRYVPDEVSSQEEWSELNQVVVTSNSVTHYFVYDGGIELYPIPATSNNVITFNSRRRQKDLSITDATTGTITTVATSGTVTTVTVSAAAVFNQSMIGRWIRINGGDADNYGDNFWYEIATVPTIRTLTLVRTYGGPAITGGTAAYTIGECGLIPENHDMLPVYEALKIYFTSIDLNVPKSELYDKMLTDGYDQMVMDVGSKQSIVLDDCEEYGGKNPNLYRIL